MAPIKEPIAFEDLPDDAGQLKAIIFRLALQKNAIIKARDDHISTLLDQNQSLECSLQLCNESLAAADGALSPAPASGGSESGRSSSTAPSSPLSTPTTKEAASSDTDSFLDLDNDEPASGSGREASPDLDSDVPAGETERGASPNLDNESSADDTEPRTSPTPSIRSQTSRSSRVSKKRRPGRNLGKASGKAVENAGRHRHCVWRYSEGNRFDWGDGIAKTMEIIERMAEDR